MPTWLTIVLALGGSALISSVIGGIISRLLSNLYKKHDREIEASRRQAEADALELQKLRTAKDHEEHFDELKKLLSPVSTSVEEINNKIDQIASGTLCTLRNDITNCYYKCLDKGYCNDYDFKNIHELYEAYLKLGGNSYIKDIMVRFKELPRKEFSESDHSPRSR